MLLTPAKTPGNLKHLRLTAVDPELVRSTLSHDSAVAYP
jgi:hypothetical protein